jgi:hypothetical protein
MRASDVIEAYLDDTVRLLPRRQREDVANELRSLLNEELHARAQESGRPPDEALALALVRAYGRPNEVAARYQPPGVIIDPADSTSFRRAAIIGVGIIVLLGALGRRRSALSQTAGGQVEVGGALAWIGLLVVAFGVKNWIRRRWPATAPWEPHDRYRTNRIGTAVVVPLATCCVILYAAPAWVLDWLTGGRLDTSWTAYTADFQRWGLPSFVGLWACLLGLLSYAAIQGRWSRLTRRIDLGLNIALSCLVLYFALAGNVFESSLADQIARSVLSLVALIYVPSVGVRLYGEIGRLDRAAAAKEA